MPGKPSRRPWPATVVAAFIVAGAGLLLGLILATWLIVQDATTRPTVQPSDDALLGLFLLYPTIAVLVALALMFTRLAWTRVVYSAAVAVWLAIWAVNALASWGFLQANIVAALLPVSLLPLWQSGGRRFFCRRPHGGWSEYGEADRPVA